MKYYIIAGEASGDLHGANLMKSLMRHDPYCSIRFWGGDAMRSVGGTCMRHIRDLAIMGFIEVVRHLRTVIGNLRFCKSDISRFCPDAIIYIDYPGFNLKIAKWAHKQGYRNFHYISPQLWAWKKGRLRTMKRDLDALYYILPFEQDFYAQNEMPQAHFVGHPLLDAISDLSKQKLKTNNFQANTQNTTHDSRPIIALLPGSRKQEISKVLPDMVELASRHPEYRFVVAGMNLIGQSFYETYISPTRGEASIEVVFDQTYALLSQAHAAIVCSGTATLETALFNVPQVVCYKANGLSIGIARMFVGKRVKYISLVNLIADKPIVTELIQTDMTKQRLEQEFQLIASNETHRQAMKEGYAEVHQLLGGPGASERTAQMIIKAIS
ncbi:MAG: lipid-A-disaccharide synthase [Bacteroidales bacterium]|nr:lipid-A-disaccharide synthase [Bacteroidales bacterium]